MFGPMICFVRHRIRFTVWIQVATGHSVTVIARCEAERPRGTAPQSVSRKPSPFPRLAGLGRRMLDGKTLIAGHRSAMQSIYKWRFIPFMKRLFRVGTDWPFFIV